MNQDTLRATAKKREFQFRDRNQVKSRILLRSDLTLAALPPRGVDVVARLHGGRKVDYRKAIQRLGHRMAFFYGTKVTSSPRF